MHLHDLYSTYATSDFIMYYCFLYICLTAIFHVHSFQSCLALRYEALVFRELNSAVDQQLHVSYREWITFAEQAIESRFYAIARKVSTPLKNATLKSKE